MMETLLIAAVLYTGWRFLKWVGRIVRGGVVMLGYLLAFVAGKVLSPSQASRDRMAVERLLREVSHV